MYTCLLKTSTTSYTTSVINCGSTSWLPRDSSVTNSNFRPARLSRIPSRSGGGKKQGWWRTLEKKKRILTKKKNQNWIIVIIWWISGAKTCSWPCCYCSGAARSLSFWYSLGVIRGLFLHITSRKKTHHYHHPWVQWHTYLWFPPKWTRHYSRWPLSHSSACSASDLLLRVMMSIILEGVYIIILEWCIHLKSASMRHTPGCAWCWRSFDWFRLCHNMLWISNLSQVHLYCIWPVSQVSALQRAARAIVQP